MAIVLLELIASLPPLKITVFPDFRQRAAASEVTFGLASKITAITPIGVDTFSILRPLGLSVAERILPTGSGRVATSRTPLAIPSILSLSNLRRSSMDFAIPFFSPFSKSTLLASIILSVFSIRPSAIFFKA